MDLDDDGGFRGWADRLAQHVADAQGVEFTYQAAQSEGDQLGQLSIAETLLSQGFDALLLSPQTDANLIPAVEAAQAAGIPVLNVNDFSCFLNKYAASCP